MNERVMGAGALLVLTVALGVSCSNEGESSSPGAAGSRAQGDGGGGGGGSAGEGGTAGSSSPPPEAGRGGEAGNAAQCNDGLQVIAEFEGEVRGIAAWPKQRRFAVNHVDRIAIYETQTDGSVKRVEEVRPSAFDADATQFTSIATFGSGFVAAVTNDDRDGESTLVRWNGSDEVEELLSSPGGYMEVRAVDENDGIAVSAGKAAYIARLEGTEWVWSAPISRPGRDMWPLAFGDDVLLVGVAEVMSPDDVRPDREGFGALKLLDAGVEVYDLQGKALESHPLVGNPSVALATPAGWLIGETNSYYGSYHAALELLGESGELRRVSDVPVISARDAGDGAYDLALFGDRLLVAGCESGMLGAPWPAAPWSAPELKLTPVRGPWGPDGTGVCSPSDIETAADLAAVGTLGKLLFLRACD
jgi:hypothetical protein